MTARGGKHCGECIFPSEITLGVLSQAKLTAPRTLKLPSMGKEGIKKET